jgi:hypothetical protein
MPSIPLWRVAAVGRAVGAGDCRTPDRAPGMMCWQPGLDANDPAGGRVPGRRRATSPCLRLSWRRPGVSAAADGTGVPLVMGYVGIPAVTLTSTLPALWRERRARQASRPRSRSANDRPPGRRRSLGTARPPAHRPRYLASHRHSQRDRPHLPPHHQLPVQPRMGSADRPAADPMSLGPPHIPEAPGGDTGRSAPSARLLARITVMALSDRRILSAGGRTECPDLDGQCLERHRADARAYRRLFARATAVPATQRRPVARKESAA